MARPRAPVPAKAWFARRYLRQHRTLAEMAAELGKPLGTIHRAMERYAIPRRNAAQSRILRGTTSRRRFFQLDDAPWLRERYLAHLMSVAEIGLEIGCSSATVQRALVALGVPRRVPGQLRPGRKRTARREQISGAADPGRIEA